MNETLFGLSYAGEMSFPEFMAKAAGRLNFTLEELEIQLDQADKNGEPFTIIVRDTVYRIPQGEIKNYFQSHERPLRPQSKDDQIEFLRRQLADKEREVSELKGKQIITEIVEDPAPYSATDFTRHVVVDPAVPPTERTVESEDDMRSRLAAELRGKPTFYHKKAKGETEEL